MDDQRQRPRAETESPEGVEVVGPGADSDAGPLPERPLPDPRRRPETMGDDRAGAFGRLRQLVSPRSSVASPEEGPLPLADASTASGASAARDLGERVRELEQAVESLRDELEGRPSEIAPEPSAGGPGAGFAARLRGRTRRVLRSVVRRLAALPGRGTRRRRIAESGLFDSDYYREQAGGAALSRDPLTHYLEWGSAWDLDPHPLFSSRHYRVTVGEGLPTGTLPLLHYLEIGSRLNRQPHPLFDPAYYRAQRPDLEGSGIDPLLQFVRHGAREATRPHPLFDPVYYREAGGSIGEADVNPLEHYLRIGGREGRSPHPLFDARYYRQRNPDVLASDLDPLSHYLEAGAAEGRSPHPLFDPAYYLTQADELGGHGPELLVHFLLEGGARGLDPHPLFDCRYYLRNHPEIAARGVNPLVHYLCLGANRGDDPHPLFDTSRYIEDHPEVAEQGVNPLAHYVLAGASTGFEPGSLFSCAEYREAYPDVAGEPDLLDHFLRKGAAEGRVGWFHDRVRAFLGAYLLEPELSPACSYLEEQPESALDGLRVGLYRSRRGGPFLREIAALLAAGLRRSGAEVMEMDERSERPADLAWEIVVAPHEFFVPGEGSDWLERLPEETTLVFNTVQLETRRFARSFRFLSRCRAVLDINPQTAAVLRQLGIPAYFVPLGPLPGHPLFDEPVAVPDLGPLASLEETVRAHRGGPGDEWRSRPLDLLFIGTLSERRERILARLGPTLGRYRGHLHLPRQEAPSTVGATTQLDAAAALSLAQRSRVVLNLHQGEAAYLEWHRVVLQGMWQGAVVVSEPSFRVPALCPGVHYLECDLEEMPEQLEWLLQTEEGARRAMEVRRAALERLRERSALPQVLGRLFSAIEGEAFG